MNVLRGLCIGAGYFAQFHFDAWRRIEEVRIVGVCDKDVVKAQRAADFLGGAAAFDNVVAALAPDVDWLSSLSAFRYFNLQGLIGRGEYPISDSLLLGVIAVAGWTMAIIAFRQRDLSA